MRAAAFLRILGLAIAVGCAALLVQQASLLASPSEPAASRDSLGSTASQGRDGAGAVEDDAVAIPVPRPVSGPPLRRYATLAGGSRFRFVQRVAAAPVEGEDEPQLPDRFGDLTLVGIMWDEAGGSGLASVTIGDERTRIVPAGGAVGDYRIVQVGRDWALVAQGPTQRRLRPRPPIMEKTRAGS